MGTRYGWLIHQACPGLEDDRDMPDELDEHTLDILPRTHWILGPYGLSREDTARLVGLVGRSSEELAEAGAQAFRIYDDDGYLYYQGIARLGPFSSGFEPLNDYGRPNAGATRIDYLERDGESWSWVTL